MKKTKGVKLWTRANGKKYLGIHFICEFWGVNIKENSKEIEKVLRLAAKKSHNTPLDFVYHQFNPHGFSAVLLLAESHIALHFWPEYHYLAVDIFTCGQKSFPQKAAKYLISVFQPQKVIQKEIKRGKISE